MDLKYKRVMLKISGEALAGDAHFGINDDLLVGVAKDIKQLTDLGVQVACVVGGGNFWRGRTSEHMNRAAADYMGMLATCINALALKDALRRIGVEGIVQTALEIEHLCEPYHREKAIGYLEKGQVVIFSAGLGSPFFSTDTAAALRAAEVDAEVILLAKKVDAVYDSDPEKNPNAKKYSHLTHTEVLEKDLKVMDSTAASLCRDNGITIHVFGLAEENGILRACMGEQIGTIID